MIFKSEATKTFINDDQEFLQELLSKENERSDTESDDSFVEEDDSTSGGQYEETVKIRELGTDVMDFESQFVKGEDKIVRAEQAINELSETEKQALFEKLGLQSDSVSTKKKKKTRPKDEMDQLWKMISDNKSHSKEFDDWLKKRWKGVEGANEKAFVNTIKKETEAMEKEFANEINDSEIKNALAWDLKN